MSLIDKQLYGHVKIKCGLIFVQNVPEKTQKNPQFLNIKNPQKLLKIMKNAITFKVNNEFFR